MPYVMTPDIELNAIAVWKELHGHAYKHYLHLRKVQSVVLLATVDKDNVTVSCTVKVLGPGKSPMSHYTVQRFFADGFDSFETANRVYEALSDGCARYAKECHADMVYMTQPAFTPALGA